MYFQYYGNDDLSAWGNATANATLVYICEWNSNNYVGLVTIPDMNANGAAEIAALYVDYVTLKHTVKIRDSKTNSLLSTLTFKTSAVPPQGIVAIEDTNGNGIADIGVLYSDYGQPAVFIKDAMNDKAMLNILHFLSRNENPSQISVSADSNGNGSSEITVLGIGKKTNTPKAETRDSKTGDVLGNATF